MISRFDDFMVHQTTDPVNQPQTSDRNYYDRYWFNGFSRRADCTFEIGVGLYPNRQVMDAHFSVATGGRQHCFHASRRAPRDRSEIKVGPLRIVIIDPLRVVRVTVAPNDTGIECDLRFRASTTPTQEGKNVMYDDLRLIMNSTR
ncbi:MAG: hypothetical protein ACE5D3_07660, partial [Candidatus Binatia bacterium]